MSMQSTNPSNGSSGTLGAILDSLHTRISLPLVGGVSAGVLVGGAFLVYLAFFRKKTRYVTVGV